MIYKWRRRRNGGLKKASSEEDVADFSLIYLQGYFTRNGDEELLTRS
jgi:hypothetical protein